tara:strand:+ start:256 stop:378 length:123 start_codon:yes stop_codon:yes gene_type:complete
MKLTIMPDLINFLLKKTSVAMYQQSRTRRYINEKNEIYAQ